MHAYIVFHTHHITSKILRSIIQVYNNNIELYPCVLAEERPTMKLLLEVMRIKDIDTTRWRDLGLELVDSNKALKVIEANHPSDVDSCCRVMFEKWLEMMPDASWNQLVAALNNIGMKTAADAVSKLLKSDSSTYIIICIYNLETAN